MNAVWLVVLASNNRACRDVSEKLRRAGLELREGTANPRNTIGGIALLDRITDETIGRLRETRAQARGAIVALVTDSSALAGGGAQRLLDAGATDAVAWDGEGCTCEGICARIAKWSEIERVVGLPAVRERIAGSSDVWLRVLRNVIDVAAFSQANVLLLGETGTGKEIVADLIHRLDQRRQKGTMVVVDCTTIPPELAASEFFGHERGAYTGAMGSRDGAFALANGGTLFLDEVGELPISMQAALLRVVQEGTFKPVGGNEWCTSQFRLICATNRDLADEAAAGRFRWDLYYRMAAVEMVLPPLRERTEDVLELARHFVTKGSSISADPPYDRAVEEYLLTRSYPGNVRDLRRTIERMLARHVGNGKLTLGDVPESERQSDPSPVSWKQGELERAIHRAVISGATLDMIEREVRAAARRAALALAGSQKEAARRLDVTARTLQNIRGDTQGSAPTSKDEVY